MIEEATMDDAVADTRPVIKSVRVLSSGWAEQHKEHRYGTWASLLWWVLTSQSWVKLPLNYFLIEHRDGLVLFDTGLDPAIASDPNYISSAIGRFLLRRLFRLHINEADQLDKVVAGAGFAASDIGLVVLSHLHFDHVGGVSHVPQAKLLVSEREWAQLSAPQPEKEWILREHIEIAGAQWRPITFPPTDDPLFEGFEGAYDLLGDGSMILLPTPGHTPGSLSMLIQREGWAPILLAGDLTYEAQLLDDDITPGTGDAATLRATYAKVRQLKERLPGLVIAPSHDFAVTGEIARATGSQRQELGAG